MMRIALVAAALVLTACSDSGVKNMPVPGQLQGPPSSNDGGVDGALASDASEPWRGIDGGTDAGGASDTCTYTQVSCVSSDSLQICTRISAFACAGIYYLYAGTRYDCASCSDCQDAYENAIEECQGTALACAKLQTCCDAMTDPSVDPYSQKTSCQGEHDAYSNIQGGAYSCKNALDGFQSAGQCP